MVYTKDMEKNKFGTPYIKPTRFKHDSGFRCFEVGYIDEMSDDNRVIKKRVLGTGSDHIFQDYMMMVGEAKPFCLNIDLTMDGYIRFFIHDDKKILLWDCDGYGHAFSSVGLTVIDKK